MRRSRRVLLLAAAVGVAALAVLGGASASCRRGKSRPARAPEPLAAGGAAVDDPDAATDAVVEDALRHRVRAWSFALDRYDVRIEDVGMSTALDAVLERSNAEVAVNGGFFDTAGKPLGLSMSDGLVISRLSTTMSGGVLTTIDGDRARLWPSEGFVMPEGARFAVQCKPRLVVDGAPNVRSDDGQRAERTALCLRDGGKTVEVLIVREENGASTGPSLYALGRFLARRGCEGALNLDGGPSTGIAFREDGKTRIFPPRRPVKQAIVFLPRRS